jgi:predicted dehydrogenase
MDHPTRRDVLTTASTLALASAIASRSYAAGDETIKIALIGCGGRGTGAAAQALSTSGSIKLHAMADAFEDRLEMSLELLKKQSAATAKGKGKAKGALAKVEVTAKVADSIDVPKERRFVGLDAYRKAIDSGVDAVLIAAPPGLRPMHFEYAVKQGKNVFMEKPLASDAPGVRRILEANKIAREKGLKVAVGLQRHHQDSYLEMIKRLKDGQLGKLIYLRSYWNGGPPAKIAVDRKLSQTEMEHQLRNWYFFAWLSGDHICEQHIHNLDVCNWIKGGPPVSAHGMGGRQVRTGKEYGHIYDHHAVEYLYEDGTRMFSQCRQIPQCFSTVSEHVTGTLGEANMTASRMEILGPNAWSYRAPGSVAPNPYQVEHDSLFDAIRNNRAYNEVEYAAMSTMTAILGRMATYSGKQVSFKEAFESKMQLVPQEITWNTEPTILPDAEGGYPVAMPGITKAW